MPVRQRDPAGPVLGNARNSLKSYCEGLPLNSSDYADWRQPLSGMCKTVLKQTAQTVLSERNRARRVRDSRILKRDY